MSDQPHAITSVRNALRVSAVLLAGLASAAISPLASDMDGPGVVRPDPGGVIPDTAPAGYLIEGRYADPPIIRYVRQPATGDLVLTRAMPAS